MKKLSLLGLAALLASATATNAAPAAPVFLAKAGASDQFEVKSSKLVLATTKNSGIRDFANAMVTDHSKSTADVKAAAKTSGLTPKPPTLNAEQRSNLAKLAAAHGAKRDALYVSQQKASHAQALDLMQGYSQDGDKPALKDVAGQIVPVVKHHIEMLNAMPAA